MKKIAEFMDGKKWYDIVYIVLKCLLAVSIFFTVMSFFFTLRTDNIFSDILYVYVPFAYITYYCLVMQKKSKKFREKNQRTKEILGKYKNALTCVGIVLGLASLTFWFVLHQVKLALITFCLLYLQLIVMSIYIEIKLKKDNIREKIA